MLLNGERFAARTSLEMESVLCAIVLVSGEWIKPANATTSRQRS
jgi:hypothetical protein